MVENGLCFLVRPSAKLVGNTQIIHQGPVNVDFDPLDVGHVQLFSSAV